MPCNLIFEGPPCFNSNQLGLGNDECNPYFDTVYAEGGPSGTDDVWAVRGPASLTCTFDREPTIGGQGAEPDGLYGPTWVRGQASLRIHFSDGTHTEPSAVIWLPVDGTERDRPPRPEFEEHKLETKATYVFENQSRSHRGNAMTHEWTFEALAVGDSEYTVLGTSSLEEPDFYFDYGSSPGSLSRSPTPSTAIPAASSTGSRSTPAVPGPVAEGRATR